MYSYVILNPYLCFIAFLYLDMYGLGEDSCIKGSSMRIIHFFVLIHIRTKDEVGPSNMFKPSSNMFTDRSKAVLLLWICFVIYTRVSQK